MVYAPHLRLTFAGTYGTVAAPFERWSFRLNMTPVTVGSDLGPALVEAQAAYTSTINARIGSTTRLTEIKAARIGADGLYTDDPEILACDVPGGLTSSLQYPPQVSFCVSLNTATRGASGRGRIYLPNPKVTVGTDMVISALDAQTYADSAAAFLGALNAIGDLDQVVVASSKGFNSVVTDVRCGRALDTMRSRRTSLDEKYGSEVAVPQAAD